MQAINAIGVKSEPIGITQEIYGLSAPPANMTGLTLAGLGGMALLRWDASRDLDVRNGGGVLFRFAPTTAGAAWNASTSACDQLPGDVTSVVLPLRTGTFLGRFADSSGILSPGVAAVVATQSSVLAYTGLGELTFHPDFAGTKSGCYADEGILRLDGASPIDAWEDLDTVNLVDVGGHGVATTATYTPDTLLDFGAKVSRRLTVFLDPVIYSAMDLLDARPGAIDDWMDIDSQGVAGADAFVEASCTDDDPAVAPIWSPWSRLEVHEVSARAVRFRLQLVSDGFFNIAISAFSILSDGVAP
ncbi:MAG: hypothetical protein HQL95_04615 [Magnetococcales bacterium]|nr:hypothetical protein [Magnetococcales bacterium]